jgi:hypothetical protein
LFEGGEIDSMNSDLRESYAGSSLISLTPTGSHHDHCLCRTSPYVTTPGSDGRAQHLGTPINPQGWGRMINIGGEGEAVGFEDYLVRHDSDLYLGPLGRPFTASLNANVASDICMRNAPITGQIKNEIFRIASNQCRFTYAGAHEFTSQLRSIGRIIEELRILSSDDNNCGKGIVLHVVVLNISKISKACD